MSSTSLNKNKQKSAETCEKQEMPQDFGGRITQKQKNPNPGHLEAERFQSEARETQDAPFLPAKNFDQIRTVINVSSMKNNSAVCSVYPNQDYTPLLQGGGQGEEKSETSSLMSASQRNIFSTCECTSRSRAEINSSPNPDRLQLLLLLKQRNSSRVFVLVLFPPRDKIKVRKERGRVGK